MFYFLCAASGFEGGSSDTGTGLDEFVSAQREVIVTLCLVPRGFAKRRNKRTRAVMGGEEDHAGTRQNPHPSCKRDGRRVGIEAARRRLAGPAGEARLGLEQFRHGHIGKVLVEIAKRVLAKQILDYGKKMAESMLIIHISPSPASYSQYIHDNSQYTLRAPHVMTDFETWAA